MDKLNVVSVNMKSRFIYFGVLADVPYGRQHLKIITEILLDGVGFRWRLYDY